MGAIRNKQWIDDDDEEPPEARSSSRRRVEPVSTIVQVTLQPPDDELAGPDLRAWLIAHGLLVPRPSERPETPDGPYINSLPCFRRFQ